MDFVEYYSKLFLIEQYKFTEAQSDTYSNQLRWPSYISQWFQTDHNSAIVGLLL